ncbi:MAG TPA: hypothetical protein VJN29_15940 [Intrasporangium sp.]|uniref:hypothetical protein n=1 Tax=Intrasporangium sp. TaxID=1925024 RepID=UPI002B46367D|nr:hypothetical protein [Intrasporangium sp.]HKX68708.1 hypothetical protein [Intrasporangium sp.]
MGLVTNVYERTYRMVLASGFMSALTSSQRRPLDDVVVLINNVDSRANAAELAAEAVRRGEISSFAFVDEHLNEALTRVKASRRRLGPRPYLTSFGLVMPHVLRTRWLLGWDAETTLVTPSNWIDPALDLLQSDSRVFHVSLHRPPRTEWEPNICHEAVERHGDYVYSYGFSDHVFLLERDRLLKARFRTFAPAAVVRHAPHPYTFEYRMESYQRSSGLFRATAVNVHYDTNTSLPGVLDRTGGSRWDDVRIRLLWQFGWTVLDRLPASIGPRFKRLPEN